MRVRASKRAGRFVGVARSAFAYKRAKTVLSVALVQVFSIVEQRVVTQAVQESMSFACVHAGAF